MFKYDNYFKPQLYSYVIQIMIHLYLANDFRNLNILKLCFEFLKKFKYHNFKIMNAFCTWIVVGYHHFNCFPIKISLLKEFLV